MWAAASANFWGKTMPLQITDAMEAALAASVVRPALLVSFEFASGKAYAWSGYGDLAWNGMTFKGVGDFGQVQPMEQTNAVENQGVRMSLSSIASALASDVLSEVRILGDVTIWLACFDQTGALIPDPVIAWQGDMDAAHLNDAGEQCTAELAVEDDFADLNRPCFRRYTNEDQQMDYPGDTGLQYVAGLQEQITFWGTTPSSINNV
jgi:hypothetical protein